MGSHRKNQLRNTIMQTNRNSYSVYGAYWRWWRSSSGLSVDQAAV